MKVSAVYFREAVTAYVNRTETPQQGVTHQRAEKGVTLFAEGDTFHVVGPEPHKRRVLVPMSNVKSYEPLLEEVKAEKGPGVAKTVS